MTFLKQCLIVISLFLPLSMSASEDLKYNYEHDSLGDRDDAEGDVTFRSHKDNATTFEYAP